MTDQRVVRHPALAAVLTVQEVAELKQATTSTVVRALQEGDLRGEQRGRFWLIATEDAIEWMPKRQRQRQRKERAEVSSKEEPSTG